MRIGFLLVVMLVFAGTGFRSSTEDRYPKDDFIAPVKGPIRLSGTFGELRSEHFHSGIDIKPLKPAVGQPVFAAADGYVSRIKTEPSGYGKAVYINHPNGYTTVYAHLHTFSPAMEEFITEQQYNKRRFQLSAYPKKNQLRVKQGEQIGTMGNSGGSTGPHLHFEIRKTRTATPVNPLLFGIRLHDNRPPVIEELKLYRLNDKLETIESTIYPVQKKSGEYSIAGDTLTIHAWRAGFALKVFDPMNEVTNRNGIYSIKTYKNGSLVHGFSMTEISFDETRFLNAHADYEEMLVREKKFHRCYLLPGNELGVYENSSEENGVVELFKDKITEIKIEAADATGNSSVLRFYVRRGEVEPVPARKYNFLLPHDEKNEVDLGAVQIYFPKGTFYNNCYFTYNMTPEESHSYLSPSYQIDTLLTPVHRYFKISLSPDREITASLKDKAFIAYCDKDQNLLNCGGKWEDGKLVAWVRQLGEYSIMTDTEAPVIKPENFQKDMRGRQEMSFKIYDNYETTGRASLLRYDAEVDSRWILMEYDLKNDRLIHTFDNRIPPGQHRLKLTVTDDRGNAAVFEKDFTR